MRIFWLQLISTVAKAGDRGIAAKILKKDPVLIPQVIRRAEGQLGITFFHRIPWMNRATHRLWEVADDRANTIIKYIDAMLYEMTMMEEITFSKTLKKPDNHTRYLVRTRDIEHLVTLNGNSFFMAARILDKTTKQIRRSLKKVERWLGVEIFNNLQTSHEKLKVLTPIGEQLYPYLSKIYAYYQDILELCDENIQKS